MIKFQERSIKVKPFIEARGFLGWNGQELLN
jgi:hypothetical protein